MGLNRWMDDWCEGQSGCSTKAGSAVAAATAAEAQTQPLPLAWSSRTTSQMRERLLRFSVPYFSLMRLLVPILMTCSTKAAARLAATLASSRREPENSR